MDDNIRNDMIERVTYYTQECPENINDTEGDLYGETLLQVVCEKNMIDQVKILLECPNLDPNIRDIDGMTALHMTVYIQSMDYSYRKSAAYMYGKTKEPADADLIQLLLEDNRVDPNIKDKHGMTAFHHACSHEFRIDPKIIKLFMDNQRVDVKCKNKYNQTPLMSACKARNYDAVKELLDDPRIDLNERDNYGTSAFYHACITASQNHDLIKLLLDDERVDVNLPDNNGETPYSAAAIRLNWSIINILLENERIDIHKTTNNNISPLKRAFGDQFDLIKKMAKIYGKNALLELLEL